MKKLAVLGLAAALSVSWTVPVLAGQWIQDVNRAENSGGISNWWYRNDDGSYPAGGWYWIGFFRIFWYLYIRAIHKFCF